MNTTNLFVELLVIGVGVLIWGLLLIAALCGTDWMFLLVDIWFILALPVLAIIYVCGIIWDRLSDWVIEIISGNALRKYQFDKIEDYYNARRIILTNSEPLSKFFEYSRSRARICRGWSLSAMLLLVTWNIYVVLQLSESMIQLRLAIIGSLFAIALAIGSFLSWKSLATAEYRKVKQQSEFLENL